MLGETKNQFSLTRAALSTCGCVKNQVLNSSVTRFNSRTMKTHMKTSTLLGLLIPFACIMVSYPIPAQPQRSQEPTVVGATDPYEVTLYQQINYVQPIGTWRLVPGMRMLKIPQIDKVPLSISLGSALGAVLFTDYEFSSSLHKPTTMLLNGTFKYLLIHYSTFNTSSAKLQANYMQLRCSLIIHRKDIQDWLGVSLETGDPSSSLSSSKFYPLPDKGSEKAVIYQKIPYSSGPYVLELLPGGDHSYSLYGHPNLADMEVTVTSVGGGERTFPDPDQKPDQKTARYELNKYGVSQISSLKIQYKGPINQQAYTASSSVRVRAPAAPDR
jgi:hypothetical protein